MNEPTIIGPALLDQIWRQARESPRKRKNFNFHLREFDPANRLLNAVEPESYVRPHRHMDPVKDETIIAVRDKMADKKLIIADGHHRYETALAYRNERRADEIGRLMTLGRTAGIALDPTVFEKTKTAAA